MIASLSDAWQWYLSARNLTSVMQRLGMKHWDHLPWDGTLGRDEQLKRVQAEDIVDQATIVLADLDDLCVLFLFSVFESIVREQILREVNSELASVRHPALLHAIESLRDGLAQGSFFRVLEPYKGIDAHLIEEVNQVRRYRNWVAHGRRGSKPETIEPRSAFARLQRFLSRFTPEPIDPSVS